ncbi:MAG: ion transporter [Pseudomonadales bacterium]|nr:ion transporter [Pseudomonadales bacterium]
MRSQMQKAINDVIFGTDTPAGKRFDLFLIYAILASVLVVILDTVMSLHDSYHRLFFLLEWFFTAIFTIEYALRIYSSPLRWQYIRSFYGIVDFVSILPSYLSLFFVGSSYLVVVRLLRVLRIFRVLKLVRYLNEANVLMRSMRQARRKILLFFCVVLVLTTIFGSLMYVIEGRENGFTSIPKSIYWAVITITTVGYGDITPQSALGQTLAAIMMLIGYSIIAVPTGIITAELAVEINRQREIRECKYCHAISHDADAVYCRKCGKKLPEQDDEAES